MNHTRTTMRIKHQRIIGASDVVRPAANGSSASTTPKRTRAKRKMLPELHAHTRNATSNHVLLVVGLLHDARVPPTAAAIVEKTALAKSTVYRAIADLTARGLLRAVAEGVWAPVRSSANQAAVKPVDQQTVMLPDQEQINKRSSDSSPTAGLGQSHSGTRESHSGTHNANPVHLLTPTELLRNSSGGIKEPVNINTSRFAPSLDVYVADASSNGTESAHDPIVDAITSDPVVAAILAELERIRTHGGRGWDLCNDIVGPVWDRCWFQLERGDTSQRVTLTRVLAGYLMFVFEGFDPEHWKRCGRLIKQYGKSALIGVQRAIDKQLDLADDPEAFWRYAAATARNRRTQINGARKEVAERKPQQRKLAIRKQRSDHDGNTL